MATHQKLFIIVLSIFFNSHSYAIAFNTNELIINSGKNVELGFDEGYLLLSVTTNTALDSVSFRNTEFFSKRLTFKKVSKGENLALIKLKAGKYYLNNISVDYVPSYSSSIRSSYEKDQHVFEVKPGVINYPGTWNVVYDQINYYYYRIFVDVENKSSYESIKYLKAYEKKIPNLEFSYNNKANDTYVAYMKKLLEGHNELNIKDLFFDLTHESDLPFKLIKDNKELSALEKKYPELRKYLISMAQINGGINSLGEYFLFATKVEQSTLIGIANTHDFEITILVNEKLPEKSYIIKLQWVDADTIHYELIHNETGVDMITHLISDDNGNLTGVDHLKIPRSGYVHSAVKGSENMLYFSSWAGRNAHRSLKLFQLNVSSEKTIKKSLNKPYKQAKKLKNAFNYLIEDGVIRAAVTMSYDKKNEKTLYHYWFLKDKNSKDWENINTLNEDQNPFLLKALSADESYFYVITDQFGDKSAIHKYSTKDLSHLGLVFEDDDFEIKGLITSNETNDLIGYSYINQGVYQMKYFDQNDDRIAEMRQTENDFYAYVNQYIKTNNQLLIYGFTPTNKGAWYLKNLNTQKIDKLFDINPDYERLPKGDYFHIKTKAVDGLDIEGFLVMPKKALKDEFPLVVIPHGGPIGVRDLAYNDSVQQFFASQGIATLKVNYRGSGGYGKNFEEEGKGQWGEKIEQDIHSVVLEVIKSKPINQDKICAMGGSYGGYSAVMLTALYPELFQCAVSWAGVMDLPLVFSNTLYNKDNDTQNKMAEIIGDPITEHTELLEKSPVYIAEKLNKPVLLLQGMMDFKVEYEHAIRMQQVALLLGLDFKLVMFANEGHNFSNVDAQIQHVARSIDFIKEKLEIK